MIGGKLNFRVSDGASVHGWKCWGELALQWKSEENEQTPQREAWAVNKLLHSRQEQEHQQTKQS